MRKILIVAGGSGGHIFPALAFAEELRQRSRPAPEVRLAISSNQFLSAAALPQVDVITLEARRSLVGGLKLAARAWGLLSQVHPDMVVGFGGYVTIPFILLSKLTGVRCVIHEQNVVPGRANRLLSRVADRVVISFEESAAYFSKKKTVLARYPVRRLAAKVPREEALRFFDLAPDRITFFVVGGSQGAHSVNAMFLQSLPKCRYPERLQIIHCSGVADASSVSLAYKKFAVKNRVYPFLNEMGRAYSAADVVVARSGAGSVKEIMSSGLPSILIPYPHAGNHQRENARILAQKGAAILLEEDGTTVSRLAGLIDILTEDKMRRRTMADIASVLGQQEAGRQGMAEALGL